MEIISTYSLLPLVSCVFVLTLGFFVWIKKSRQLLHILFLLYSFTLSLWLFGTFALFNAVTPSQQIFWDRFVYVGVVFIPIFLYHFGLLYSNNKHHPALLYIGYICSLIFLPISQLDIFSKGLYTYKWGVHTIAQPAHHFFLIYFSVYFLLFFANLLKYHHHVHDARKKQVRLLIIGFAVLDLVGPLAFLPAYGIPVYPVIFLSALPFVLLVAYAIIKHNALEVKTIAAEIGVTMLTLAAFAEVFLSKNAVELLFRSGVFLIVLVFSLILLRSVKKEIDRREQVLELAHSLERANIRLQELDRQKTEFLSIASHQLRTPLSILKGYIELIDDGAYGKVGKKMHGILHNMDESNERLVRLVNEFLNITRLEQERTKYVFAKTNIAEMVGSVVEELGLRAKEKGLSISWKVPKGNFAIVIDEEKVRQVAFNYIDNAIKYSDVGVLVVTVKNEGNGLAVRVQDRGFGFEKQDEVNFFQKFYRGENVKGTNVNGTGLGLYVCRKFIEAHGGKVWAHSAGLKKGSEFGFWLPKQPTGQMAEATLRAEAADHEHAAAQKHAAAAAIPAPEVQPAA